MYNVWRLSYGGRSTLDSQTVTFFILIAERKLEELYPYTTRRRVYVCLRVCPGVAFVMTSATSDAR